MKIFQKIKHSITKKIFLLIVLSIGASFAVSLLVIKKLENAYANYVYEAKRDLLNSSMAGIEDKLAAYENGTYQFITNDRIQVYASALKEAYDILAEMERAKMQESVGENLPLILEKQSKANQVKTSSLVEILKELDTILVSGYKVDAGYFVDLSGKVYNGYGASKYRISDKNLEIILNNAMKNNGSAGCGIIQITEKNGELCNKIYLSRILRERKNLSMEYCGTVIYLIAPEELAASLLTEHDDLVILDEKKNVIFSSFPIQIVQNFFENPLSEIKNYEITELDGKKYFTTSILSPKLGWQYYNFSDYLRQFAFIQKMDIFYTAVLLGMLMVIGILAAGVSVNMMRPIVELSEQIDKISRDSNPVKALNNPVKTKYEERDDEIGHLEKNFASMTRRLGELIHENYEQKLYLQNAQLSALRSKLNPHFLYNTLDTIRWMATEEKYHEIPGIVKALGDILRISINSREALIPIKQEIEYTRGYLVIQRARFGTRLNVQMDIGEEMMEIKIPAFSLQPLVENSVKYAMEQVSTPCRIRISVKEMKNDILCIVSDNGNGMDLDIIKKLQSGDIKAQGNGVGLINLDERLKSLYGLHYGVMVEKNQEGGATVSFRVKKEASLQNGQNQDFICR